MVRIGEDCAERFEVIPPKMQVIHTEVVPSTPAITARAPATRIVRRYGWAPAGGPADVAAGSGAASADRWGLLTKARAALERQRALRVETQSPDRPPVSL